jgi:23S rRNA U2552 (ribose-2'-O)-methylase RlmE/FtsJ
MDITATKKPWQLIRLYKRNIVPIAHTFELFPLKIPYIFKDDEILLHEYRNRIHAYEVMLTSQKNWEYYKKIVNPYELVYTQKKYDNFPDSVCFLRPLSRSYFKMIEMLDLINFFGSITMENIRTAHVCEGPGGFIEALFEEAFRNKKKIQISVAMTLKSRQTNIPGWKRASHFLQKNKNVRILYGDDETGNILKPENQEHFIDYCINPEYGSKMNIFTADGGFDFSMDYTKQEEMIFPLLVTSTKIGFEVLKRGGVFILKLFDFYQKSTTDLIYFLASHFQEWTLYKPATSRPCNPEHYFIGKGFVGCSDEVLDTMRVWCQMIDAGQEIGSLFKSDYPVEFKEILVELQKNSFKRQTEYLERVFDFIENDAEDKVRSQLLENELTSYEWCVRFKAPIYAHRLHSIVASQICRQAACPR